MLLFIGLIMGGVISIYKSSDKSRLGYVFIFLGFIFMSFFSLLGGNNEYRVYGNFIDILVYFSSGILEGIGTIIPGISSTALLMLVGVYNIFISSISNLFNINYVISNLRFLVYFSLGLFISIIICIYIMNYLFLKYKKVTFSFILGIILSNILFLILQILTIIKIKTLVIGIPLLGLGFIISLLFDT
jgi:putative membrane protein